MKTKLILFLFFTFNTFYSFGDFMRNYPYKIKQPSGSIIACFISGDEFYHWLHDKDNYTIIQNTLNGYYYYALLQNDNLIPSSYVVGATNPSNTNLSAGVNISAKKMIEIRNSFPIFQSDYQMPKFSTLKSTQPVTNVPNVLMNNLVVFIRFHGDPEFTVPIQHYNLIYNNETLNQNSVFNYFLENSYGNFSIKTYFYPNPINGIVCSYEDINDRCLYIKQSITNPSGYTPANESQRRTDLLERALNFVKTQVPSSIGFDSDKNGRIDNITFLVQANDADVVDWADILWPHASTMGERNVRINGLLANNYNLMRARQTVPASDIGNSIQATICHELCHTIGFPDLYHYNYIGDPVGLYDNMCSGNSNLPNHTSTYMKYKYGKWIAEIPEIRESGTYTLNPIKVSYNNCYKIQTNNPDEFIVLEYRQKQSTYIYENNLYGSGLVIYKINKTCHGNAGANPLDPVNPILDEVYTYRPFDINNTLSYLSGDFSKSYFSNESGRTIFSKCTNPYPFLSNNQLFDYFYITDISNAGETISFNIKFCNISNLIINSQNIKNLNYAKNNIETSGSLVIANGNNIVMQAGNSIKLLPGFKVEKGATFYASTFDFNCSNPSLKSLKSNTFETESNVNSEQTVYKQNANTNHQLNISPNPTNQWIQIVSDNEQIIQKLEIYSIDGKLLYKIADQNSSLFN